jgi:hypothetical protein
MPTSLRGIATKAATPFAEASLSEEPGAGKLHAGISAGAVGQLVVLPRWRQAHAMKVISYLLALVAVLPQSTVGDGPRLLLAKAFLPDLDPNWN